MIGCICYGTLFILASSSNCTTVLKHVCRQSPYLISQTTTCTELYQPAHILGIMSYNSRPQRYEPGTVCLFSNRYVSVKLRKCSTVYLTYPDSALVNPKTLPSGG